MHHYPHHIGDYRKNTGHLTNEQDLTYRRLLEMYYDTEQPIPTETQWVSRRLRVDIESVQFVLDEFFKLSPDGWRHDRCDDEIAKYSAIANRNRHNGKLGGRPKKTQTEPSGLPVGTQMKPTGKPTKNQEPRTSKGENPLVSSKLPTCPHQEILAIYGAALPTLPQPRIWDGAREKNLAARWRWALADMAAKGKPHDLEAGLDFFRRLFGYVAASDFLTGRSGSWSADLGWIVKAENFAKIIQGNYENKQEIAA